jgi:transposase
MLEMSQYELIKTAHRVYGKSIHEIAKEFGHSRNTIRKALREVRPEYQRKKTPVSPVMDPYRDIMLIWLKSDASAPRNQRHTARRIYCRLVEEYGFVGAESTVRRYVRHLKIEEGSYKKEAFIPLEPDIGQEAEVDWGRAVVIMGGERRTVELFCMRSKYSGRDFVRAYPHARQEMFFDGHIHGFHYFGGVFPKLIYDNLTSAVLRVLRGKKRIEQQNFIAFRSYYTFESVFCNLNSGHEKGGVEGLVGYARRNYLVPVPRVTSFAELNEHLLRCCLAHGQHRISGKPAPIDELFRAEQPLLLPLPEPDYPVKQVFSTDVDHYSTIKADGNNRYSVPTYYCGLKVNVELGIDRVLIYYNRDKIAEHERVFGKNKWQLEPFHYLELLARKPMAFESARPIRQWRPLWPASYERLLALLRRKNGQSRGTKLFIRVLLLLKRYPEEMVHRAIDIALQMGFSDAASLELLIERWQQPAKRIAPLEVGDVPKLATYQVELPDLDGYGALLKGGCQ